MGKRKRYINIIAYSNLGTRLQLTLTSETDDIRELITTAVLKISRYENQSEQYKITHIDSMNYLEDSKI
jgi:hypothetical protein